MNTRLAEKGIREFSETSRQRLGACYAPSRTILLISHDKRLHENLRFVANTIGLFVVKAARTSGTVAVLKAIKPAAVLLDLDLPHEAAWQLGDVVLKDPGCPAVVLLSGRTAQFDMRTAIRAGSLVSKRETPDRLLEVIQKRLELRPGNREERNAIQRVLLRWLRPSGWGQANAPAQRLRKMND